MREFTSFLAPLMRAYVSYQKASGRWNESSYEVMMTLFDRHCKKNYPNASELSQEMVSSWCGKRETETNNSCRSRIYPVVSFIRYLRKTRVNDRYGPRYSAKRTEGLYPARVYCSGVEEFLRRLRRNTIHTRNGGTTIPSDNRPGLLSSVVQ